VIFIAGVCGRTGSVTRRSSGLHTNLRQDEINSLGNRQFRNFDQLISAPEVDLQRQWVLRQRIFKLCRRSSSCLKISGHGGVTNTFLA
jgi:hypothetical protein